MATIRKNWDRTELLLVMNLYCRIPFGRQHSQAPEIIDLAKSLGRTPGSVAMKLNNITSLDPKEKARGIKGLLGASNLDRQVWNEFDTNWKEMVAESELLWKQIVGGNNPLPPQEEPAKTDDDRLSSGFPTLSTGSTEGVRVQKIRLAQGFFRRTILAIYAGRCCVSDIPIPELLIASHILPWASFPDLRTNPCNGLCLSRLHDAAFDQGFITFDDDYRLVLSKRIKDYLLNESLRLNFSCYEGRPLRLPEKFFPAETYLSYHREHIFLGQ